VYQNLKLAIALSLLWLLLSGHFEALILAFGVFSIALVVWLSARMRIVDGESYPFSLIPRLSGYWAWLLKEIVKSNIDVAKRVLGPSSAVQPLVFDVQASQSSDLGLVIFANSITLTPGTVSLDLEKGRIRVHALHPDIAKGVSESGMDARVPDAGRNEGDSA
jgi:multicomponent Na+:H+ antiporter subunit E